jgi:hypothetical protein
MISPLLAGKLMRLRIVQVQVAVIKQNKIESDHPSVAAGTLLPDNCHSLAGGFGRPAVTQLNP